MRQVLGLAPAPRPPSDYLLWVHGASVGETLSSLPLVRAVLAREPAASVLITATTATALSRLSLERLGPRVVLQHGPADSASVVRRFLRHWRPDALVLVESELWPTLLMETREARVPIALLNGRLSDASTARWSAAAPRSLRYLLSACAACLAQSAPMAGRLRELGAPHARYVGDLKQLRGARPPGPAAAAALREALGERAAPPAASTTGPAGVWLAASTHAGEEAIVFAAHAWLRRHLRADLLLAIAPRHPERGAELAAAARAAGLEVSRRGAAERVSPSTAVYVCDTLGELPALYALCGVAFVGGTLVPLGGHNVLEAAAASIARAGEVEEAGAAAPANAEAMAGGSAAARGCVVLHGPHVEAVSAAVAALGRTVPPAARPVADAASLAQQLRLLLVDPDTLGAARLAAAQLADSLEAGLLERVWDELRPTLGLRPWDAAGSEVPAATAWGAAQGAPAPHVS